MNTPAPISWTPPRWRGFNLCEMFVTADDPRWPDMTVSPRGRFVEDHFRWIAGWGFNFVRLPLSYRWWSSPAAPDTINEAAFAPVDEAVTWAQRHGVHLSVNLHHAPGFCINEGARDGFMAPERFNLWKDRAALDCFVRHWEFITRRYAGLPPGALSFDLVNEPARCTHEENERVVRATVRAIRAIDPARPVVIDGCGGGNEPCPELADLGLIQSCRGYVPFEVTHHLAWWAGSSPTPPAWPQTKDGKLVMDRAGLAAFYDRWVELKRSGVPVHCGEMGCYNFTPHPVFLAWLEDLLAILTERDIGWGLWNLRGSYGVLDSARADVDYTDWHGCKLDTKMLQLLQRF